MIPQPQPNIDHIQLHTTVCKMDRQETREDDDGEKWMDGWDRRRQMASYQKNLVNFQDLCISKTVV
ncbi:hypothetical protein Dsin_029538 [Dipteronia sinensis]|uniref:Uncharacterized protein n=1 Tax=Dipteronia sinensis TaxID=43782 RepID=A0AAD9ZSV9_9ROSI|nr:hypothetical protein Dsin_029538 [Dipteronia sinensis]